MSRSSETRDMYARFNAHENLINAHEVEIFNLGNGPVEVVTTPPGGMLKVRNIYFNPSNGRFRFEYDDEVE